jgi:DmsE family decaheme c-type cytochrome
MKTLTTLIASGLISCALLGFSQPVQAESTRANDEVFSALRDYAQSVGAATTKVASTEVAGDGVYSQLLGYAQQAASDGSSLRGMVKEAASKAAPKPATKAAPAGEAHVVGSAKCATCHAQAVAEFNRTLMGRINQSTRKGSMECESCHGPGSKHVAAGGGRGVGGMNAFRPTTPEQVEADNALCLACHQKGGRTAWEGSTHETRGVACTNCHTVMRNVTPKKNLKTAAEMDTCFQCHKLQRAQMQFSSHMPVREGKVTCSDCHNPHGSATEKMIREASINENCYKCHAEKRGPLLWEHAPVREDCLNCHNAHGSNYENLLKVARPRLCHECHSMAHSPTAGGGFGTPTTPYVLGRSCGNCHSNVHGSNHPNGMFFLR